jgi:hypothetical protein
VVLLRGRKLALVAEEWRGVDGAISTRLATYPGTVCRPISESRSIAMKVDGRPTSVRAIPIGLPASPYVTERGAFDFDKGGLTLSHKSESGRVWLPLLLSWDETRARRTPMWRVLTVSERSKVCAPGVAFAARVGWGSGEGLVVYRSLARPALRTFLGHQTSARFLVGRFTESGDVVPLIKWD